MDNQEESKLNTLEQIKRLLVLLLIQKGSTGKEIAEVLKVSPATVSRMLPARKVIKKKDD